MAKDKHHRSQQSSLQCHYSCQSHCDIKGITFLLKGYKWYQSNQRAMNSISTLASTNKSAIHTWLWADNWFRKINIFPLTSILLLYHASWAQHTVQHRTSFASRLSNRNFCRWTYTLPGWLKQLYYQVLRFKYMHFSSFSLITASTVPNSTGALDKKMRI